MRNKKIQMIVEAGVMIALAYVLSLLKIFTMPNGGSITPASMVPILLFALRWGGVKGLVVGFVYGTIQFILGPKWSFHPISILFDYSVAFACLGLVGFFNKKIYTAIIGIFIAIASRFLCHVISGAIVFASYAPEGQNPWIYSAAYNASYLIPELVISLILTVIMFKSIPFLSENKYA